MSLVKPYGPMDEWSSTQFKSWINKQIGDLDPDAATRLLQGWSHQNAMNWTDASLLEQHGISCAKTREALLIARDKLVIESLPSYSVELFGLLEFPRFPTSILIVRNQQIEAVPCSEPIPQHHAEIVTNLHRAYAFAKRAMYNRGNAMTLLKIAIQTHMAIMENSELKNDLGCGLKMGSRVWEMVFFLSLFSCRGWLRRLVHTQKPIEDNETFRSLSKSFVEQVLPSSWSGVEWILDTWENDTARLVQAMTQAGVFISKVTIADSLAAPEHLEADAWQRAVADEESWIKATKTMGPHVGIRQPELRAIWCSQLFKEEVPWQDFWAALHLAKAWTAGSWVAHELERPESRQLLQSRIHILGNPDTISALEADLAFPPLASLSVTLEGLLRISGRSSVGERQKLKLGSIEQSLSAAAVVEMFAERCRESGAICILGDASTGKHLAARQASEQLVCTGLWDRSYEVDLRSATTATEAADMLAAGLHAAPYCLASHGTRSSGRARLSSWAEAQSCIPLSDKPKIVVVGLIISHINRALLEDEIESDSFVDVLCSLMDQIQQAWDKSVLNQTQQVALQLIITAQKPLELPEGRDWFVQSYMLQTGSDLGAKMFREAFGCGQENAAAKLACGDEAAENGLLENMHCNPHALKILGSACGCGVVTPADALALLKRRMPASVAMGRKTPLPPGVKPTDPRAMVTVPKPDDQLKGVRAGRKFLGDTKVTLQTPLARVMIALKAFTPEYLQMALVLLSYIPTCFDLQLATRILTPISERQITSAASILRRLIQFHLLKFDPICGTFTMEASVQNVVQCLMQYGDPGPSLKSAMNKAVNSVLDTCGAALSQCSSMVSCGAPVCGLYILQHHLPLFWKVQYWSQEHVLDTIGGTWLISYLQPMIEHPAIFIQHLPAGARSSLCRMMAAAAGYIGSHIGKAVVLWHLGQAQMEEGQLKGAMAVLERGIEALDMQRSPECENHLLYTVAAAPSLATKLLEAQLNCGLAVCSARMADSTKSRQLVKHAMALQHEVLEKVGNLEQSSDKLTLYEQQPFGTDIQDLSRLVRDVHHQLACSLLLNASIEMAMSEHHAALSLFAEVTSVAGAPSKDPLLQCMALGEHGAARAHGFNNDWDSACAQLSAATDLWESSGTPGSNAVNDLLDLAEIHSIQGAKVAAAACLAKARSIMQDRGGIDTTVIAQIQSNLSSDEAKSAPATPGNAIVDETVPESGLEVRGCFKPILQRFLSKGSRSASNSPNNSPSNSPSSPRITGLPSKPPLRAYNSVVGRWQLSLEERNPAWGWCGVKGWPLDIWFGSPAQASRRVISPLITRTVTISHAWLILEFDKAVEEAGMLTKPSKPRRGASAISRNSSRSANSWDGSESPDSPSQTEASQPASLPKEPKPSDSPGASGSPRDKSSTERASAAPPPVRRRRPAGRQASGSLAHARTGAPQTLESKVARYATEGGLGEEDRSQSISSLASAKSSPIIEEEEEEEV